MEIKILNPANVPTPKIGAGEVPFFVDSETGLPATKNSSGETVPTGSGGGGGASGKTYEVTGTVTGTFETAAPIPAYGIINISAGV